MIPTQIYFFSVPISLKKKKKSDDHFKHKCLQVVHSFKKAVEKWLMVINSQLTSDK